MSNLVDILKIHKKRSYLAPYASTVYVVTFFTVSPSICSAIGWVKVTVIFFPVRIVDIFLFFACSPLKILGKINKVPNLRAL